MFAKWLLNGCMGGWTDRPNKRTGEPQRMALMGACKGSIWNEARKVARRPVTTLFVIVGLLWSFPAGLLYLGAQEIVFPQEVFSWAERVELEEEIHCGWEANETPARTNILRKWLATVKHITRATDRGMREKSRRVPLSLQYKSPHSPIASEE